MYTTARLIDLRRQRGPDFIDSAALLDRLLLRLWPDAEVVEPPELRDRVRELAARTRERYRDGPP